MGLDVSRETVERLTLYVDELNRWNRRINLIGPVTIDRLWQRHVADCAQLWRHRPAAGTWADLGSGAGLPGLVIAILAAERSDLALHLVESDARKAAFLSHVVRRLDLPCSVHAVRIETLSPRPFDVVSARALASLTDLVGYSHRLRTGDGRSLFPKGRTYKIDLDEALRLWDFDYTLHPSRTEPDAVIVEIGAIHGPR